jgi:hypothetical protein
MTKVIGISKKHQRTIDGARPARPSVTIHSVASVGHDKGAKMQQAPEGGSGDCSAANKKFNSQGAATGNPPLTTRPDQLVGSGATNFYSGKN